MSVVSATRLRLDNTVDRLRAELRLEVQGLRDEMSEIRTKLRAIRRQQQRFVRIVGINRTQPGSQTRPRAAADPATDRRADGITRYQPDCEKILRLHGRPR
jgi:hypothetical protein